MDVVQAQATIVLAKMPPAVTDSLNDPEFWTTFFPLGYVVILPFLKLLFAALSACWKKVASMRKGTMMKRAATRKVSGAQPRERAPLPQCNGLLPNLTPPRALCLSPRVPRVPCGPGVPCGLDGIREA